MDKKIFYNGLLTVGSLLFVFIVLEVVCRWMIKPMQVINIEKLDETDYGFKQKLSNNQNVEIVTRESMVVKTDTGLRLRPNVKATITNHGISRLDVEVETNSLGFRSPEIGPKEKGDFRILVLGDSITIADYLPFQSTYPSLIEQYFRSNPPAALKEKRIQVINAGIASVDLQNQFSILMERGLSVKPDVVLVGLYLNDAAHALYLNINEMPWVIRKSYLLAFVYRNIILLTRKFNPKKDQRVDFWPSAKKNFVEKYQIRDKVSSNFLKQWPDNEDAFNHLVHLKFWDWGYAWSQESWDELREIFTAMKKVAQEKGFQIAVVFFPVRYQVHRRTLRNEPQEYFEALMSELELTHVDLLPLLRTKYVKDSRNIFYDHCHFTHEGMVFISYFIAQFLNGEIFSKFQDVADRNCKEDHPLRLFNE